MPAWLGVDRSCCRHCQ